MTDQRALPLSGTYTFTATGSGVNAYVIDTGIRKTHTQGGRAVHGVDTTTPVGITSDGRPARCRQHEPWREQVDRARAGGRQRDRSSTPQQVRDGLYALTTKNVVTDARSANAHLLFSNL